jgi:hypothetical protein
VRPHFYRAIKKFARHPILYLHTDRRNFVIANRLMTNFALNKQRSPIHQSIIANSRWRKTRNSRTDRISKSHIFSLWGVWGTTRAAKPKFQFLNRNTRNVVTFGATTAKVLAFYAVICIYFIFLNVAIMNCSCKPLTSKGIAFVLVVLFVIFEVQYRKQTRVYGYNQEMKQLHKPTSIYSVLVWQLQSSQEAGCVNIWTMHLVICHRLHRVSSKLTSLIASRMDMNEAMD